MPGPHVKRTSGLGVLARETIRCARQQLRIAAHRAVGVVGAGQGHGAVGAVHLAHGTEGIGEEVFGGGVDLGQAGVAVNVP